MVQECTTQSNNVKDLLTALKQRTTERNEADEAFKKLQSHLKRDQTTMQVQEEKIENLCTMNTKLMQQIATCPKAESNKQEKNTPLEGGDDAKTGDL